MKEIFGLATSDLMLGVVAVLAAIGAVIAVLAWRQPLFFRLGLRNVPRRRAQSSLIVLGLMISTLIIAAAFTVGDTLSGSLRNTAFELTGPIDHLIQYDAAAGRSVNQREAVVPQQVADDLVAQFDDDPDIVGFVRAIFDVVSAENLSKGQAQPQLTLLGLDPAEVDAIDGIPALGGGGILLSDLQPGKIILNESAADDLAAEVGDTIQLRVLGRLHEFQVSALAEDALLSGQVNPAEPQGAVIHFADAQAIFEQPERMNGVGVTVRGGIAGAVEHSDEVDRRLNRFLMEQARAEVRAVTPFGERLYSDRTGRPVFESIPFKKDTLDDAETFGSIFTTFFLVMGLFSIAAGILLILLIFAMLAEERKTEMGIARAVGMQRGQLVQAYLAEGLAYDLGAAVVGTAAGVLIAFGMVEVLNIIFGEFGLTLVQRVEPRSLVIAAGIGIIITFVTVVVSSFRVSQMNIVAAIRDLPADDAQGRRRRISVLGMGATPLGLMFLWTTVISAPIGAAVLALPLLGSAIRRRGRGQWVVLPAWTMMRWRQEWWFVFLALGGLGVAAGLGEETAFFYLGGLSLFTIGLHMLARRLGRAGRLAPTLMGALILFFWLAPQDWHQAITGKELEGDIEMFILSGIMMVTGATVLVTFNLDLLIAPLRAAGRLFGGFAPAVRAAVAYPTTARYRTGMTVAMIAIIMFALITFTTINANFARAFTSDAAAGEYDVQADSTRNDAISDLQGALAAAGAGETTDALREVGRLQVGSFNGTDVRALQVQRWDPLDDEPVLDAAGAPIIDAARDFPELRDDRRLFFTGADDAFLRTNAIPLQARAIGFDSDRAVWDALLDGDEPYAVVTANAVAADDFGADDDAFEMPDTVDEASQRIPQLMIRASNAGRSAEMTIIGVIDQVVGVTAADFSLPTLIAADVLFQQLYDDADLTRHLARVAPGEDPLEVARAVEAAVRIETVSIKDELEKQQELFNTFLALFQGYTGLGLFAGLAALGVIAVRIVVERRQQIGVLRAIGFQRRMVGLELLMEMGFIASLGISLGVALAVALAWRLFTEGVFGSFGGLGFYVPVARIAIIAGAALIAGLVMTYLPARAAARVPVTEALRYE